MTDTIAMENAAMEHDEAMATRPQDYLAGRGKFTGCRECGSQDSMQAVHREIMEEMPEVVITLLVSWYSEPGNNEELFYPCHTCNPGRAVPDGYKLMTLASVRTWADGRDPMAPDYEALAREEPVNQIGDSRDAAGLEG